MRGNILARGCRFVLPSLVVLSWFLPAAQWRLARHAQKDDIEGAQDAVAAKIAQLRDLLLAAGLLAEEVEYEINDEGVIEAVVAGYHPVQGLYPAAKASALWNYILIEIEDGSLGAHNPPYTRALLDASIVALQ